MQIVNIFWFRRDLRLHDNAGLYHALKSNRPVIPVFIFDRYILDKLEEEDRRVEFIHAAILEMQTQLLQLQSSMEVVYGFPAEVFKQLAEKYTIETVFTNHDYEPYAKERDAEIKTILQAGGTKFQTYKDQVVFEKTELVKIDGKPYSVFSPYSRNWLATLNDFYVKAYPTEKYFNNFFKQPPAETPTLASMGFKKLDRPFPSRDLETELIRKYGTDRDYPSANGTSRLGVHLRFGTVSVRDIANRSRHLSATYVNELIWRDFYHMVLWNYPQVGAGKAFKPAFDRIRWRNNEEEFDIWCRGVTGYPIVDAGIRELNETGFMHNRVRMVVASFLTKHLLIDWRWGEAYFAQKLLDFDLASNNGGWQWASGSGCDAAPFFRIFNPYLQAKKFDKAGTYISRWVPEYKSPGYPPPVVDHEFARKRCLEVFRIALREPV